ncbi:MAG: hypothetical protein KAR33_14210, partial [Candidatus Thorarchaeota archaeon]|nr:hypothetical protein [Candidatus Thorarchaeota archaeon]
MVAEPIGENMNEMRNNPVSPVILDRYEDFEDYARKAALVMYRPEYYRGPFLDDPGRIRRVTFTAVGVQLNGVVLNFIYTLSHEDMYDSSLGWEEQAPEIDKKINEMVEKLRSECGVVRGGLTPSQSFGEAL